MANCSICGSETRLFVRGTPMCMNCEDGGALNERRAASEVALPERVLDAVGRFFGWDSGPWQGT